MNNSNMNFNVAYSYALVHALVVFYTDSFDSFSNILIGMSACFITGMLVDFLVSMVRLKLLRSSVYLVSILIVGVSLLHVIYNEAQPDILNAQNYGAYVLVLFALYYFLIR